jgi:hypothetical protein
LDPDSSRVVVTLGEGRTLEAAAELIRTVTGRAPEAVRQIGPGVQVFEVGSQGPGRTSELLSRLRNGGIASIAVPAYRLEGPGSDLFLRDQFIVQFSPGVS